MIRSLLFLFISAFILTGTLNTSLNIFPLALKEVVTIFTFIFLALIGLTKRKNIVLKIDWGDRIFLGYIIFITIIPYLVNSSYLTIDTGSVFGYFIPVKIYIVYRIFMMFIDEYSSINKTETFPFEITNVLLVIAFTSAIISLLMYLPGFNPIIEWLWPITTNGQIVSIYKWKRLWGTMSATNGAASFFSMCGFISLYSYLNLNKKKYFYYFFVFMSCLILSGSFSSIFAAFVGLFLFSKKFKVKGFNKILYGGIAISVLMILSSSEFSDVVMDRFLRNFNSPESWGILPSNLFYRLGYWSDQFFYLFKESVFIFGFGPGGIRNLWWQSLIEIHANPESFYMAIILESGLFGFSFLIIFFKLILNKTNYLIKNSFVKNDAYFLKILLIMIMISNIGNMSLYYGGNLEIFAFIVATIHSYYYYYKIPLKARLSR